MQRRVSVRDLVEFILRTGSIDSGFTGRNRLEEGARIHRKLQKAEGYQAEVFLSVSETHGGVEFIVEGRADGVIVTESGAVIDEIKTTLTPLEMINEDHSQIHWAQAMCYGHIYCVKNNLERIAVRLTYYEMESGGVKRFTREFEAGELSTFFAKLLEEFAVWARFENEWKEIATASMRELKFPFQNYREGQRRLAAAVYKTITEGGRTFAMAPTGVGKTISTLFPAIKAMGEAIGGKIFYLTAKTITRQAAQAALEKMRENGLRAKSVTVTAKDKICFLEERVCKPTHCIYADGHFDRINDAIMHTLENCESMSAETIADYAKKHLVCPFELSLDLTEWSDVVICDYNYLFDPQVYLRRFFSEYGEYVFLVDEAHNLADRAREMFSARISKRDLLTAKKSLGKQHKKLRAELNKINKLLLDKLRECLDSGFSVEKSPPRELITELELFAYEFSKWLGENPDPEQKLLEVYFDILVFLKISELYNERYVTLFENAQSGELTVKLFCADPASLLDERLKCGRATVLFSATLTPAGYFKEVLGGGDDCKYLALPSPFPRENLLLLIADGISTKYKDRGNNLGRVADMIYHTVCAKTGNYIAYFPSYNYLADVYSAFIEKYPGVFVVRQEPGMTEDKREDFLGLFKSRDETMVAFCVLGGMFSEGVDLPGDRLIGAIIVGVGLPQINTELDIIRDHYGGWGRGFDYAYRFPGMNKVLQAAGRVIRSAEDKGVVLLIDDRFTSRSYTELFPEHWQNWRTVSSAGDLTDTLEKFYLGTSLSSNS